ncbi:MAG: hypothetical protein QGH51_06405 [Planctomycetota bacterium]|jgi:hypothetical protein|nr:hypothetical protein [Planctomycetota bacterium]MDP6941644.1 hypothetical protein [Planctomycetota bacterium]
MTIIKVHLRTLFGAVLAAIFLNWAADATGIRWRFTGTHDQGYEIFEIYKKHAGPRPDVVAIGSSMTRWGVLPPSLAAKAEHSLNRPVEVWNLGLHGGTSSQVSALLELAFSNHRSPRVLLLELGPSFWNEARTDSNILHYWRWFAPLSHTLTSAFQQPWAQTREGLVRAIAGCRSFWLNATSLASQKKRLEHNRRIDVAIHQKGSFWGIEHLKRDLERNGLLSPTAIRAAQARKKDQLLLVQPWQQPRGWETVLAEVVAICEKRGTRLIAWAPPISKGLRDGAPLELRTWKEWATASMQTNEIPFWDYLNEPSIEPGMFFNLSHLAPTGALQLSVLLADRLAPYLRD